MTLPEDLPTPSGRAAGCFLMLTCAIGVVSGLYWLLNYIFS